MVAFNEIEVWILHFFGSAYVGLATRRPPVGGTPGGGCFAGGRAGRTVGIGLISCRINGLRLRYPHSGQLYIMGIIRTRPSNPLRINDLRAV